MREREIRFYPLLLFTYSKKKNKVLKLHLNHSLCDGSLSSFLFKNIVTEAKDYFLWYVQSFLFPLIELHAYREMCLFTNSNLFS